MNSSKLRDWLELVGMVGIVVSLVFVGLQLRQSEAAAQIELSESTATRGVELSTLMTENTDVWLRACAGEELTTQEQAIANHIFFRYFQGNFNSWVRYETTGVGALESSFLVDAFAANIHRYPGFRGILFSWTAWAEKGARVNSPLVARYTEEITRRLSELEQEEPSPNAEITWCGIR
jgi:hypothetical protein